MMPVIPPPILPDAASITDDKDALYGMLISWYMSGYHTGYYQVSVISVHFVLTLVIRLLFVTVEVMFVSVDTCSSVAIEKRNTMIDCSG